MLKPESFFKSQRKWRYGIDIAKIYFTKNNIEMNKVYKTGEFKNLKNDWQKVIDYLTLYIQKSPCKEYKEDDTLSVVYCLDKQEALGYLGIAYQLIGDSNKAYEFYTKAIKTHPSPGLYARRALLLYYDRGDNKGALADCEKTTEQDNPFDKFGNLFCTDEFIERLKQNTAVKKPLAPSQSPKKGKTEKLDKAW